eukprot:ctg_1665.g339
MESLSAEESAEQVGWSREGTGESGHGNATNRRRGDAAEQVRGGVQAVRPRWRRQDNRQRVGHDHALAGADPDGAAVAGHGGRGGCGSVGHHRLFRVSVPHVAPAERRGRRGGGERGVRHVRQEQRRQDQRRGAAAGDGQAGRATIP